MRQVAIKDCTADGRQLDYLVVLRLRLRRELTVSNDLPVREARPHHPGENERHQQHREDANASGANTLQTRGPFSDPDRHYLTAATTSRVTVLSTAAIARAHSGVLSLAGAPTGAVRSIATAWPPT